MRSVSDLFERMIDPGTFEAAVRAAVKGKRRRPDVAMFLLHEEHHTRWLHEAVTTGTWSPIGFEMLLLHDPKPRVIARAPIHDRVVHTAVAQQLQPVALRSAIDTSFACRPGLGTHRAVLRLLEALRHHRFALHLDIRSYFPSIDPSILMTLLARTIRDSRFLDLLGVLVDDGRGLYDSPLARRFARISPDWPPPGRGVPIGALTSQIFAGHVYLNELDHWVKRTLRVPTYVRYMDDLYLFADRRADLRNWRREIGLWLGEHRHLRLKAPEARILSCAGHLDGLGHRITRDGVGPLPRKGLRRMTKFIRRYVARRSPGARGPDLAASMASRVGHLLFGV